MTHAWRLNTRSVARCCKGRWLPPHGPFGDSEALAILLAVPHHPESSVAQKIEAEDLLAVWEAKGGHWRGDRRTEFPRVKRNLKLIQLRTQTQLETNTPAHAVISWVLPPSNYVCV